MPRPAVEGPVTCPRCGEAYRWRDPLAAAARDADGVVAALPVASRPPAVVSMRWPVQLAGASLVLVSLSVVLKVALPESSTAQRGFPFMVIIAGIGLVVSLWLWFLRKRRTNAVLGFFVLGNMLCVALMIIPPAVYWTAFRRSNDPQAINIPPPPTPVEAIPISPATLPALGYLPDDCNLVAGIHVAELFWTSGLLAKSATGEARPG